MSRFTDFFWPTLEKPTPAELAEDVACEAADIAAARAEGWTQSPELALKEARRLADSEEDRRRTTEGKASTYLLFAAAFAAALIPFLPGILEGKTGSAPRWLIAIILIVAALYLMGAGLWAFRTLRVGTYHRLDVVELMQVWRHRNPTRALIRETFAVARMNYRAVNEKVSCIKMAHEFMARSFIVFGILVVVEAGWEAVHSVTATHESQVVADTKAPTKPSESETPESTPTAPNHSNAGSPDSAVDAPSSAAASGTIKPNVSMSTKPAESSVPTSAPGGASPTPAANIPMNSGTAAPGKP